MHRRLLIHRALGLALPTLALAPPARAQAAAEPAVITDSSIGGPNASGFFFHLAEVDGEAVADDARRASLRRNRGGVQVMLLVHVARPVPAGRRRLKLVASQAYARTVDAMFRGTTPSVEGTLEVDLQPGRRYRVAGVLDAFRRELWLEDEESRQLVGSRIVDTTAAQARAPEMAGASFTCCNLHYEGDWISDANWATLPMIPAGARIVVKEYGRHHAQVLIDGRPMRVGLDFGREQQTTPQFIARLMVRDDPRPRLAGYTADMQQAIGAGRAALGMTREQALMALGPPRTDRTPSLQSPRWVYFTHQEDEFVLVWGDDGLLKAVEAAVEGVKALVVHPPE